MKVKILTDGHFRTANAAIGQVVEATPIDGGGVNVDAKELQRVGCSKAFGSPYPYFDSEIEVVSDDN